MLIKARGTTRLERNFIIIYLCLWSAVLMGTTFRPYDLYLPSDYAYLLLIIHVATFTIGFCTLKGVHGCKRNNKRLLKQQINVIGSNWIFIILVLLATGIAGYYYSIFLVAQKAASSLGEIRAEFFDNNLYGPLYDYINGLFLVPMQIICFPLAIYYALYNKKWICIPMLIFLYCSNSLGGGRFGYIKIFYSLVFVVVCLKKLSFKNASIIGAASICLFVLLSWITAGRSELKNEETFISRIESGIDTTLKHITTYACGACVAFDYALEDDYVNQIGGYGCGGITGSSVVQIAYIILNKVGLPFEQPIAKLTELKQDSWISTGPDTEFNALYTSVLFYYTDFGIIGVLIIPLLLGMFCRYILIQFQARRNIWLLCLSNFIFIEALFSITDFQLTQYSYLVSTIALYWLGTRRKDYFIKNVTLKNTLKPTKS